MITEEAQKKLDAIKVPEMDRGLDRKPYYTVGDLINQLSEFSSDLPIFIAEDGEYGMEFSNMLDFCCGGCCDGVIVHHHESDEYPPIVYIDKGLYIGMPQQVYRNCSYYKNFMDAP